MKMAPPPTSTPAMEFRDRLGSPPMHRRTDTYLWQKDEFAKSLSGFSDVEMSHVDYEFDFDSFLNSTPHSPQLSPPLLNGLICDPEFEQAVPSLSYDWQHLDYSLDRPQEVYEQRSSEECHEELMLDIKTEIPPENHILAHSIFEPRQPIQTSSSVPTMKLEVKDEETIQDEPDCKEKVKQEPVNQEPVDKDTKPNASAQERSTTTCRSVRMSRCTRPSSTKSCGKVSKPTSKTAVAAVAAASTQQRSSPMPINDAVDKAIYALFPMDALRLERTLFNKWKKSHRVRKLTAEETKRLAKIRRTILARGYAERARQQKNQKHKAIQDENQYLRDENRRLRQKIIELEKAQRKRK